MGLKGKLIAEFELKSSADEFHHQWHHEPHHISAFSTTVHGCDEKSTSKIICSGKTKISVRGNPWFCQYGKALTATHEVEFVEETKTMVMKLIGGEVKEDFKTFVLTLETIPHDTVDLIRWTIDYERLHEDVPHPVKTLEVLISSSSHVQAEHSKKRST